MCERQPVRAVGEEAGLQTSVEIVQHRPRRLARRIGDHIEIDGRPEHSGDDHRGRGRAESGQPVGDELLYATRRLTLLRRSERLQEQRIAGRPGVQFGGPLGPAQLHGVVDGQWAEPDPLRAVDGRSLRTAGDDDHQPTAPAPEQLEWLQLLGRRGGRLMVVVTRRAEGASIDGAQRIRLGPLTVDDLSLIHI